MRYCVLGSGSRANSFILEGENFSVVIDQGYALPEFYQRLSTAGFCRKKIRYIFLTHQHSDHIKGVPALAQDLNIPVIAHKKLKISDQNMAIWGIFPERYYCQDGFSFTAFSTSHDSPYSVGYHITIGNSSATFLTDTGKILPPMYDYAENSDLLFLESNYSPTLLKEGPYPAFLKSRISSPRGHLSNQDAGNFLLKMCHKRVKNIYLCHLSETNNSPEVVYKEISEIFRISENLKICPKDKTMDPAVITHHHQNLYAMKIHA
ncbi:MAG: MBL fold metallo-hydrolase [Spirochaetia bacterium]